jgi:hypothetical protein
MCHRAQRHRAMAILAMPGHGQEKV